MPMYSLIKYSDNYSKTSGSMWQYCKDTPTVPFEGTHLVAVKGLITERYPPKCVNGKSSTERRYFVR